jgi:hypothetical protein
VIAGNVIVLPSAALVGPNPQRLDELTLGCNEFLAAHHESSGTVT